MTSLTLGTAKITKTADGAFILNWMGHGSWTIGEQTFGNINPALRFCRERGLSVVNVAGL